MQRHFRGNCLRLQLITEQEQQAHLCTRPKPGPYLSERPPSWPRNCWELWSVEEWAQSHWRGPAPAGHSWLLHRHTLSLPLSLQGTGVRKGLTFHNATTMSLVLSIIENFLNIRIIIPANKLLEPPATCTTFKADSVSENEGTFI